MESIRFNQNKLIILTIFAGLVVMTGVQLAQYLDAHLSANAIQAISSYPSILKDEPRAYAPAAAVTEEYTPAADTAEQKDLNDRGQKALAKIDYPWQTKLPGWTIEFKPKRSGFYGLTLVKEQRIEIYIRDDQSDQLLTHVIAHEIGHVVDVTLNDGHDRKLWQEARNIEDYPWWPNPAATDFSTGAGDFAESFAAWQTGKSQFRSDLGSAPTYQQIELLAELSSN